MIKLFIACVLGQFVVYISSKRLKISCDLKTSELRRAFMKPFIHIICAATKLLLHLLVLCPYVKLKLSFINAFIVFVVMHCKADHVL